MHYIKILFLLPIEDILSKLPDVGKRIFEKLDHRDLAKCRTLSKNCKSFVDSQKFGQIQIIRKCLGNTNKMFEKILSEHHLTSVKKVAAAALEYKKENNVSMVLEFTTDFIKNSVMG